MENDVQCERFGPNFENCRKVQAEKYRKFKNTYFSIYARSGCETCTRIIFTQKVDWLRNHSKNCDFCTGLSYVKLGMTQ